MIKKRIHAFAAHLGASFVVVCMALGVIVGIWYPWPFFQIQGLFKITLMLIGIDLVLGPLLTLIVYKHGKPSLKFDLTVIVLVQLSALTYGVYSTFIARPVYSVFYGDRFEVVSANEYVEADLEKNATHPYARFSITGPRWVGAIMPSDPKEKERMMFSALAGGGLKINPQYYVPYDKVRMEALQNGKRASELIASAAKSDRKNPSAGTPKTPTSADQIDAMKSWLSQYNVSLDKVVLLPMKGIEGYATVALDGSSGTILGARALDPWWY